MVEEYGLVLTYLPPSPLGKPNYCNHKILTFSHTQKPGNGLVRENLLLKFVDEETLDVEENRAFSMHSKIK